VRAGILAIIDRDLIVTIQTVSAKRKPIKKRVIAFFRSSRTEKPEFVERANMDREAVYSTSLGYGFAITHCKSALCQGEFYLSYEVQRRNQMESQRGRLRQDFNYARC
jgi:mannitol/fructose-specific phosphotransferase system IIA component (Ntr-type)